MGDAPGRREGRSRLIAFVLLFIGLTIAGALWSLAHAPVTARDLAILAELPPSLLALLAALCAGIYATDVLRYRSLGAAVGAPVGWRAGLEASVANFFFSWITPGSTFGAPATIYMLGRRGVAWDAAVVIAFGKAFTGVAVVVVASLGFVAAGLGPAYDAGVLGVVLFGGAVFALLFGAMVAAALRPAPARRLVAALCGRWARRFGRGRVVAAVEDVTQRSIERLTRLRAGGPWPLVELAITHVAYFAVFAGVGVVLIRGFGGEVGVPAFAATVVYIAFTYLAPTPGGAGFAEAAALPFFGSILPPGKAVVFVLCFRGLTLFLQVCFAVPYLVVIGGGGEIAARAARR